MNKVFVVSALVLTSFKSIAQAQESKEKLNVKVGGYIRTETFYDSYRSSESRDGESYQYPLRRGYDATGRDTNRINQFEMLGLQSRFRISASGLSAFGASLTGSIEGDFMGSGDDYKLNFSMRHAFMKFQWQKSSLLLGQYWSPLSLNEFAPNTVLFASGTTFQPQARAVQARMSFQVFSKLQISGTVMAHSTHHVAEPKGTNSQRLSGLPDMLGQIQYGNPTAGLFFAFTGGYKFLRPYATYVATDGKRYEAEKNVGSLIMQADLGYQFPGLSVKFQGNLGENMTNYGMIGGYSPIKGSANERGEPSYSNITTSSFWADFETKGERFKVGLFAGYSENLGTKDTVDIKKVLVKDADIKHLLRIAPRMYIINGPVDIGIEYIMNAAVYGKFVDTKVVQTESRTINNRILVSVRYTF